MHRPRAGAARGLISMGVIATLAVINRRLHE